MRKLVYIHVPKCGGNSVKSLKTDKIITWSHNLRKEGYLTYPNSKMYGYKKIFPGLINYFYYSFTIVRNPWSRAFSAYNYLCKGGNNHKDFLDFEKYVKEYNSFEDFIKNGLLLASKEQLHFKPQTFWLLGAKNKLTVEKVIKLEQVDEDFPKLMSDFDIEFDSLKKENKSTNLNYKNFYNQELIDIVADIYKEDIKLFNYNF